MNTYRNVKNRLLLLLEAHKLSIHALSIRSGIAPSTIKNILYGKSVNPGIVTIKMMCDGLGISLYDFFNTTEFKDNELEDW